MAKEISSKNLPLGKIIITAIIYMIISQVIHFIGAMVTMTYYMDPQYHKVWSVFMMPVAGPPPLSFTLLGLAFALINASIFVSVYAIIKNGIPGQIPIQKGLMYGFLVFLLVGVSFFLALLLLVNLPINLLVYWLFEGLVIYLINGLITAKIIK